MLLLLIYKQKIYRKKRKVLKRQKLLDFMWSVVFWKTLESNFRLKQLFNFQHSTLFISILNKSKKEMV